MRGLHKDIRKLSRGRHPSPGRKQRKNPQEGKFHGRAADNSKYLKSLDGIRHKNHQQEEGVEDNPGSHEQIRRKCFVQAGWRKEGYKALQELLCCKMILMEQQEEIRVR